MEYYVRKYEYEEIIGAIREIVLDVGPVASFKITGQGLPFFKSATEVGFGGNTYSFGEVRRLYDLVNRLRGAGYGVEILLDFYERGETERLEECSYGDVGLSGKEVRMKEYFSDVVIGRMLEDYCRFYGYSVENRYVRDVVNNDFDFENSRKACYWVAYWLVDLRRASVARVKSWYNGDPTGAGEVDKRKEVTVTVGEVFRVTERQEPRREGERGFTAIWGDVDSYWARLQMYLKQNFERMFNDFSLRDNVMRSSELKLEKHWSPFAYVDTFDFSRITKDIYG